MRRRLGFVAVVLLGAVALALAAGDDGGPAGDGRADPTTATTGERLAGAGDAAGRQVTVGSITDGDTFRTTGGERVRVIGIDTPEVGQDECFADEATAALEALLPPGTEVRLVVDVEPLDRFDRTLAYVERVADGLDVGLRLATDGFAAQLTVPPNVAREAAIGAAVAEARAAGRGLWATDACVEGAAPPPQPAVGTGAAVGVGGAAAAPPTTAAPAATPATTPPPPPTTSPPAQPAAGCDPAYPDACIPPAPPDLDCPDVAARRFTALAPDPHGFDGDHDGVGCES